MKGSVIHHKQRGFTGECWNQISFYPALYKVLIVVRSFIELYWHPRVIQIAFNFTNGPVLCAVEYDFWFAIRVWSPFRKDVQDKCCLTLNPARSSSLNAY